MNSKPNIFDAIISNTADSSIDGVTKRKLSQHIIGSLPSLELSRPSITSCAGPVSSSIKPKKMGIKRHHSEALLDPSSFSTKKQKAIKVITSSYSSLEDRSPFSSRHIASTSTIASSSPSLCQEPINGNNASRHNSQFNIIKNVKPIEYVQSLYQRQNIPFSTPCSLTMSDYFLPIEKSHLESYGEDVIRAIRSCDIPTLRTMKAEGRSLQSCNRFGESLIHMACRRSTTDLVSFLIKEGEVSLRVKDDYGRTPLHDACWAAEPNLDLVELILDTEPELMLIRDRRGHTPLDYMRREHWGLWSDFLKGKVEKMLSKAKNEQDE